MRLCSNPDSSQVDAKGEVQITEQPLHTSREAVMEMMLCAGEVRTLVENCKLIKIWAHS